jgi:predicted site-specific integrase-resolvase
MNLKEWAVANGVHPHTAYRWFREGTLPVPVERVGPRTILVNIEANSSPSVTGGVGLYARVSSHDQKADLERQVARLSEWAAKAGHRAVRVESEIASGMNGGRRWVAGTGSSAAKAGGAVAVRQSGAVVSRTGRRPMKTPVRWWRSAGRGVRGGRAGAPLP